MKIVILGARGMLGKDLGRIFYDLNPYLLDKDELDIIDKEGVSNLFRHLKPDVVINAAAYTDVDGCETNRELAMTVNGKAPGHIAAASRAVGAVLVHYSTDYVFDGNKAEGYAEDDEPGNPLNFYGGSKLAGENAVREAGGNYYLIRTSWLFGVNGRNFVETILRLAQEKDEIRIVNDQHGKPTFSLDLARKTRELIEGKQDFGVYHVTNDPHTTWYDFATEIIAQGLTPDGHRESGPKVMPCTSDEFPCPARRPKYSILLNTKLLPLRPWKEALLEYMSLRK